jgi:hypothetical protein
MMQTRKTCQAALALALTITMALAATATHAAGSGPLAKPPGNPTASHTPTPTPTHTATPAITPTPIPRGDCNVDGQVDAADLTSLVLEIFDGDGDAAMDVPGGSFPGNPRGCDPNADSRINAGDLACGALLIFGTPGGCGP